MVIGAVFEDVAGLAVEGPADGFEGGEADGAGLACLENREVGRSDAYSRGQFARGHLAAGEHYVDVDYYCHDVRFVCGFLDRNCQIVSRFSSEILTARP